jgi:hypothetical protein
VKYFFITVLCIFSSTVFASDTAQSSLEYMIKNLNQISLTPQCSEISETDIALKNCDQKDSDHLTSASSKISAKLDRLIVQIGKFERKNLKREEVGFVKEVEKTLKCLDKRVSKKVKFECQNSYLCEEPYNYVMYVEQIPGQLFQDNSIKACSNIFSYDSDKLAGIILHEISHLCGTDDLGYLKDETAKPQMEYEQDGKKISGAKNADSYRYWLEKGFSLPQ